MSFKIHRAHTKLLIVLVLRYSSNTKSTSHEVLFLLLVSWDLGLQYLAPTSYITLFKPSHPKLIPWWKIYSTFRYKHNFIY